MDCRFLSIRAEPRSKRCPHLCWRKCRYDGAEFGTRFCDRLQRVLGATRCLSHQVDPPTIRWNESPLQLAQHLTCRKADRPTEAETTNDYRLILARTSAKPGKSVEESLSSRDFQVKSGVAATGAVDRSDLRMG
jgi:hypothetical protein